MDGRTPRSVPLISGRLAPQASRVLWRVPGRVPLMSERGVAPTSLLRARVASGSDSRSPFEPHEPAERAAVQGPVTVSLRPAARRPVRTQSCWVGREGRRSEVGAQPRRLGGLFAGTFRTLLYVFIENGIPTCSKTPPLGGDSDVLERLLEGLGRSSGGPTRWGPFRSPCRWPGTGRCGPRSRCVACRSAAGSGE